LLEDGDRISQYALKISLGIALNRVKHLVERSLNFSNRLRTFRFQENVEYVRWSNGSTDSARGSLFGCGVVGGEAESAAPINHDGAHVRRGAATALAISNTSPRLTEN
jgi:hypothetical protein